MVNDVERLDKQCFRLLCQLFEAALHKRNQAYAALLHRKSELAKQTASIEYHLRAYQGMTFRNSAVVELIEKTRKRLEMAEAREDHLEKLKEQFLEYDDIAASMRVFMDGNIILDWIDYLPLWRAPMPLGTEPYPDWTDELDNDDDEMAKPNQGIDRAVAIDRAAKNYESWQDAFWHYQARKKDLQVWRDWAKAQDGVPYQGIVNAIVEREAILVKEHDAIEEYREVADRLRLLIANEENDVVVTQEDLDKPVPVNIEYPMQNNILEMSEVYGVDKAVNYERAEMNLESWEVAQWDYKNQKRGLQVWRDWIEAQDGAPDQRLMTALVEREAILVERHKAIKEYRQCGRRLREATRTCLSKEADVAVTQEDLDKTPPQYYVEYPAWTNILETVFGDLPAYDSDDEDEEEIEYYQEEPDDGIPIDYREEEFEDAYDDEGKRRPRWTWGCQMNSDQEVVAGPSAEREASTLSDLLRLILVHRAQQLILAWGIFHDTNRALESDLIETRYMLGREIDEYVQITTQREFEERRDEILETIRLYTMVQAREQHLDEEYNRSMEYFEIVARLHRYVHNVQLVSLYSHLDDWLSTPPTVRAYPAWTNTLDELEYYYESDDD